jgi:hypothetical protein
MDGNGCWLGLPGTAWLEARQGVGGLLDERGQARPAYTVWRESYASLELGAMYARLNNISKWDRGAALP